MHTRTPRGEAAARYAREHDVSLSEAARRFGISRERVRQKWRDIFGDAPAPVQEAQDRRVKEIVVLASRGLSATEIAGEIDSSLDVVRRTRDRAGIAMVSGHEKIAVTGETKAKILELARAGKGRAEIAHETGASYGVVTKYLIGHSTQGVRGLRTGVSATASEFMDRTGCALPEAAAKFAVAPPALYAYRKRRGLWTTRRGRGGGRAR